MFYLHHHNDLEQLAGLFSVRRENAHSSPLQPDTILVPNHGMGRWLSIQVAENAGVAANMEMVLPGGFIWQLLGAVNPDNTKRGKHFEADALPWHLYLALLSMADEIDEVARYLDRPVDEVRRWQLANQLAQVFDKYLVYRPDMLAAWEKGDKPTSSPGDWQASVWRYLTRDHRLGINHRARILRDFITQLGHDRGVQQTVRAWCPANLYCFGLVALAPEQLRLLYALAEHIDVHFMLPNPSEEYWGDMDLARSRPPLILPDDNTSGESLAGEIEVEAGHPLLAKLGRMARDTLRLLYSGEFDGMIEIEFGDVMAYTKPKPDSLLHRIQHDIVTLDCSHSIQGMDSDDTSLEIHACHSPLREVQVLQDQLLDRLARDDQRVANDEIVPSQCLAPRDIIVMLPDVAAYAPAIEAVFGGAPQDRYLPFGLADRARSATHPIMSFFAALLDLPLSRWQASELLDMLAIPAVMRRFGITASELDTITRWVQDAGIRWGRNAAHRKQLGAGGFEQNSWQFGLDRLLLGVAQSDDETLIDGVAPWSNLEGGATAALGKLWRFEQTLAGAAEELAEPATADGWHTRLNRLIDQLIEPASDDRGEQRAVDALHQLVARFETADECTQEVPLANDNRFSWEAVRDMLHGELNTASDRQPFLAGGITFCGMVPLRAVPFRVVCILGLNDDVFPREDTDRSFNVMYQQPRLGDRNVRDDDRLLFLQALTAARDAFYISYIGQDVRTGEALPPSPIVGEMLAFIHHYYSADARLVHRQPMQPFSQRYFSDNETADPRVFTYAGGWHDTTQAALGERRERAPWLDAPQPASDEPGEAEPVEPLDLNTLKYFFDHPSKVFFRERVQLNLELDSQQIDDDEPVALDNLTAAKLRQRLFDSAAARGQTELDTEPSDLERARGLLPPAPLAHASYAEQAERVNELLPIWQGWQAEGTPESVDIDLPDISGVRVVGRVGQLWPGTLRRLRTGKLKTQYRMRYWIDYLALVAAGHDVSLEMAGLSPKKNSLEPVQFAGQIQQADALDELTKLVSLYQAGQKQPLHYHPDLADEYNAKQDKALSNVDYRFKSTAYERQRHHLLGDAYFSLLLGDDNAPLGESEDTSPFIAAIEAITEPLNTAIRLVDEAAEQ